MEYPKTILHVDDDPSILRLVSRCLKKHGVETISLENPMEAISVLAANQVRVVLTDIDMPKKDGLTLLREIKQCDAGIQVIMCTSMVSISTVLHSTALGAETCIFKPLVDLGQITGAVDRAFEKMDRWWIALHEWSERQKSTQFATQNNESTIDAFR